MFQPDQKTLSAAAFGDKEGGRRPAAMVAALAPAMRRRSWPGLSSSAAW